MSTLTDLLGDRAPEPKPGETVGLHMLADALEFHVRKLHELAMTGQLDSESRRFTAYRTAAHEFALDLDRVADQIGLSDERQDEFLTFAHRELHRLMGRPKPPREAEVARERPCGRLHTIVRRILPSARQRPRERRSSRSTRSSRASPSDDGPSPPRGRRRPRRRGWRS